MAARRQARIALGRDPNVGDLFSDPPKSRTPYVAPIQEPEPVTVGRGVSFLSLCEAAARLGVSRHELERMIDAGKVAALPTGFTRMIPTAEVRRLTLA